MCLLFLLQQSNPLICLNGCCFKYPGFMVTSDSHVVSVSISHSPTSEEFFWGFFFSVYGTICMKRNKYFFVLFTTQSTSIRNSIKAILYCILCRPFMSECVAPSWVSLLMKCCGSDEVLQQPLWSCSASDRVVPASCCWHPHAHHWHIVLWPLAIRGRMVENSGNDQSSP